MTLEPLLLFLLTSTPILLAIVFSIGNLKEKIALKVLPLLLTMVIVNLLTIILYFIIK